ncbi:UDP-N-acetylmuramoyl-L-alanine--D-glutamate ligase [Chlamydiales bacterium]|nr:UDP-N-acetylmuramoyl-L-alanine--D-glutamate ligase [Chlamydiales bacterium]
MKTLILGRGRSGLSCEKFLKGIGVDAICLNTDASIDLNSFDQMVISPGINPNTPLVQSFKGEIISEVEVAFRYAKNSIIGITGTNGKSSLTHKITHLLNLNGIKAHAVGNIGRPITDALCETGILVTELSSFQLEKTSSKALDLAIILNITPDHLDRHLSFKNYVDAKLQIANLLKLNAPLIVHRHIQNLAPQISASHFFNEPDQALLTIATHYSIHPARLEKAHATYTPLPHRLEWVGSFSGIDYYNDSKATNVDSVIYALKTLPGPIYLIAGGTHKGESYKRWRPYLKKNLKKIYLIGEAAPLIEQDLQSLITKQCHSLDCALNLARKEATAGSKILLSPGCSSFDQFKNFEERGDLFRQLVRLY